MKLKTANHNRKRAYRRAVLKAAFEFDMAQIARGRDRSDSRFVRRMRRASRRAADMMLPALTAPSRPWFQLEDPAKYLRPTASPFVVDLVRRLAL